MPKELSLVYVNEPRVKLVSLYTASLQVAFSKNWSRTLSESLLYAISQAMEESDDHAPPATTVLTRLTSI